MEARVGFLHIHIYSIKYDGNTILPQNTGIFIKIINYIIKNNASSSLVTAMIWKTIQLRTRKKRNQIAFVVRVNFLNRLQVLIARAL